MLQGQCKQEGIWEWRFFADECQQRMLGIFGSNSREGICLIGCSHHLHRALFHDFDFGNTMLRIGSMNMRSGGSVHANVLNLFKLW